MFLGRKRKENVDVNLFRVNVVFIVFFPYILLSH